MRDLAWVGAAELEVSLPRQQYSLGVVASALGLVLRAGTPLRRVAGALTMGWRWGGLEVPPASWHTVRLWLLRLGLYQLKRPKRKGDDWMWIVDHTMQLGGRKCLIIVGLPQSAWNPENRVLGHDDVELLDLQPVSTSDGKVVHEQLEAAAARHGAPRAIISDAGSDLRCGIERFRQAHEETAWLYDIKHKTACLLKAALEADASWSAFVARVQRFKQQVALTELAALAPPQQRSKARYMNVDALTDWAEGKLQLLDCRRAITAAGLKRAPVEEKLGWLRKFDPQVRRWGEMLAVAGAAEHYVRTEGIHAEAAEELAALFPAVATPAAKRLRKALLEFVAEEARQARPEERLLGSSEVLESLIGKFKQVAGQRGQHGLTGMVLSLGALAGRQSLATAATALAETTTQDVWDWCRTHLGSTVQSVRGRIRQALAAEQKPPPIRRESG